MMDKIMVIDDDLELTRVLDSLLQTSGYQLVVSNNGKSAIETIKKFKPEVVLLDLKLPDTDGFKLYQEIINIDPRTKIIIISAYGNVETGMEAARLGAFDFIEKPFSEDKILITIKNAFAQSQLEREVTRLKEDTLSQYKMVGCSKAMAKVFKLIDRAASSEAPVFILGESGVGKDLVARAIHFQSELSGKLVKINCAAIPSELVESELFGYEPGAFTDAKKRKLGKIEISDGGTLFLNEIGDMSVHTQAKLLSFLEEGEFERLGGTKSIKVKTRVIAATNKEIRKEIEQRRFREDLYYRLNVIRIEIPPLRKRVKDIPVLIEHFLNQFIDEYGLAEKKISKKMVERLTKLPWHGNCRELKNVIERLVVLSTGDEIDIRDLGIILEQGQGEREFTLNKARKKFERDYIIKTLKNCGWKLSECARILDVDRSTLYRKLKQFGIEKE